MTQKVLSFDNPQTQEAQGRRQSSSYLRLEGAPSWRTRGDTVHLLLLNSCIRTSVRCFLSGVDKGVSENLR